MMSAFFCKKISVFLAKIVLLLKTIVWELCYRFFSSAPNWPKIGKMTMTSQFSDMTSSSNFFDVLFSLVEFSNWYNFHINIIIGFGIMTIFCYKGLTRNLEIPLPKFCPISGDWGKLWIPNLVRMSLTKCYWMQQNAIVTAFTVFELLRENQQMVKFLPPSPPPT